MDQTNALATIRPITTHRSIRRAAGCGSYRSRHRAREVRSLRRCPRTPRQGRPPHPVNRQFLKKIFARVNKHRQQAGAKAGQTSHAGGERQFASPDSGAWRDQGKIGPAAEQGHAESTDATIAATATGMKLRGFHSNSNNSTASSTAATGVAKTADIPAAAPATSSVLRSAALR